MRIADLELKFRGYPERTSGIECGSGFQPRQLNSRLEAAPTESLSNGNLDFPDKQVKFYTAFHNNVPNYGNAA